MIRRSRVQLGLLALGAILASGIGLANATSYSLVALANGGQEVGPVATPGTALANFTYDDVTNQLTWSVTYSGLLGTPTASHIHLGPGGVIGGVIISLGVPSGGAYGGSTVISAANETNLLTNDTYYNLHTNLFPGGEVRGALSLPTVASDESAWGAIKALYAE